MGGGSDDSRTPDDEPNAVDAGWDALIGETEEDDGDAGQQEARPVADDHAVTPSRDEGPSDGKRDQADDVMARLMAGEAPRLPVVSNEPSAPIMLDDVAQTSAAPTVVNKSVIARSEPATTAELTARVEPIARVEPAATKEKVVVRSDPTATKARKSSGSLRIVGAPVGKQHAEPPPAVRAARPAEAPVPAQEPAPRGGVPWALIGVGVIAVAAVAYAVTREDTSSSRSTTTAQATERSPQEPQTPEIAATTAAAEDPESTGADTGPADAGDDADSGGTKPPKPRTGDPREPPPDTPAEIAAVFRRLPVGPADRPPVGGIGASGIHVDHIAMGTETQGATCRGRNDDFSVSVGDRAGVCVRVVHPREKEELQVLWEKQGGSTRRSKMVVLPMHAYRTRGYLVLRNEYIGDWTVHILSSDGVELARHDFTVVP